MRIAHITGPKDFEAVVHRRDGLRHAMEQRGLPWRADWVMHGEWSEAWGREAVARLIASREYKAGLITSALLCTTTVGYHLKDECVFREPTSGVLSSLMSAQGYDESSAASARFSTCWWSIFMEMTASGAKLSFAEMSACRDRARPQLAPIVTRARPVDCRHPHPLGAA
jgi:hypothetical protein